MSILLLHLVFVYTTESREGKGEEGRSEQTFLGAVDVQRYGSTLNKAEVS